MKGSDGGTGGRRRRRGGGGGSGMEEKVSEGQVASVDELYLSSNE